MSEVEKTALEIARENLETKATAVNTERGTAKGTRIKVGSTRGKNPQAISFENFDESLPDTLPTTLDEFMGLSNVKDEPKLVALLIAGFNSDQYTQASDPIAEYVEASWSDEVQTRFRAAVRNYANLTGVSIEDAVTLIKPGVIKSLAK